jgi:hypothetical protein
VPLDLASVYAKLSRAEEHAKAVEEEIKRWVDTKPYSLSFQTNADFTRYSIIIHLHNAAPIQQWSLMIADSVHNFRCALDHLVYTVAILEAGGTIPPPYGEKLMFPICDNSESFEGGIRKWRLGSISVPVRAVFELFQPGAPRLALFETWDAARPSNQLDHDPLTNQSRRPLQASTA